MSSKLLFALPFLATAGLLAITPGNSRAAGISWGSPANISGDSNVSTPGTLIAAYSFGASAITTVNGVAFSPFAVTTPNADNTVGLFKLHVNNTFLASNSAFGYAAGPFSSLSPSYQALLQSGVASSSGDMILTLGGLLSGQTYSFQWWSNDSNSATGVGGVRFPYTTRALDSSFVDLNDNTSAALGGLGTLAIGTFTATGPTETVTFSGEVGRPLINAFELRQTSSVVPLPPAVWAGLSTLVGLGGLRLLRRRRAR